MQPSPKEEGVTYLCVADVQITDRRMGKLLGQPMAAQMSNGPKVQHMRMVGHVRQKDLDIPEATPIIHSREVQHRHCRSLLIPSSQPGVLHDLARIPCNRPVLGRYAWQNADAESVQRPSFRPSSPST